MHLLLRRQLDTYATMQFGNSGKFRVDWRLILFFVLLFLLPFIVFSKAPEPPAPATDPQFAVVSVADVLDEGFVAYYSVLTVAMTYVPDDTVFVIVHPGIQLNVHGGYLINDTLMFTPFPAALNPQEVKVKPWNDADYEGDHFGTVTFTVESDDPAFDGGIIDPVTYAILDNEFPPGITTDFVIDTVLQEGLGGVSLACAMNTIPTDMVYITIDPDNQLRITGIPGEAVTLAFEPNASALSLDGVNIRAVEDALYEGPHTGTVTFTISSADPVYGAFMLPDIVYNIADNDNPPGINYTPPPVLALTEGETDELPIIISLQSVPTDTVKIWVSPDAQLRIADPGVAVALVFPPNTSALNDHVVNVKVYDDYVFEGDHSGSVNFSIETTDADYADFTILGFHVDITDNELEPAILFSDTSGFAGVEGDSILFFTVQFGSVPLSTITMTLQPDLNLNLGKGPGDEVKLKFRGDSALLVQTVDVFITDDYPYEGPHFGYISITLTGDDPAYTSWDVRTIRVSITDNDEVSISSMQPDIFNIYPTLATTSIQYQMQTPGSIQVFNALGTCVYTISSTDTSGSIDISAWPPGKYFLLTQENGRTYYAVCVKA